MSDERVDLGPMSVSEDYAEGHEAGLRVGRAERDQLRKKVDRWKKRSEESCGLHARCVIERDQAIATSQIRIDERNKAENECDQLREENMRQAMTTMLWAISVTRLGKECARLREERDEWKVVAQLRQHQIDRMLAKSPSEDSTP